MTESDTGHVPLLVMSGEGFVHWLRKESLSRPFIPREASGVSTLVSPANPAAMLRTLLLNVPPWLKALGASRVEMLHHVLPAAKHAKRATATQILAQYHEIWPDPQLEMGDRRERGVT